MKHKIVIVFLSVFFLSSCAETPYIRKGSLEGYGSSTGPAETVQYDFFRLWPGACPDTPMPAFCLRLHPGGPTIRSDEMTEKLVSKYLPASDPASCLPKSIRHKAKNDVRYSGDGFSATYRSGKLNFIYLGDKKFDMASCKEISTPPAVIGPDSCERFYSLPLTRAQFVDVFGSPDKEIKVTEIYYGRPCWPFGTDE